MNKKYTFAIDIDGVLRHTLVKMVEIYNKTFNDTKTCDDVFDFMCEKSFPRIEKETGINPSEWFFQYHIDILPQLKCVGFFDYLSNSDHTTRCGCLIITPVMGNALPI